jgi:outer membrane protein OmpA-like peptidoglycan-associated protein
MAFESMFRKASVTLVAGAYALLVEAACLVQAKTPVMAGSPPVGSGAPYVATTERIVLHAVRFQTQSDRIDKCSVPILDYAVQILKRSPESLVYLKVRAAQDRRQENSSRNSTLTNRRTRAVVRYFAQRGISATRLVRLSSGSAQSPKPNFETVQLDLASRSNPGVGRF